MSDPAETDSVFLPAPRRLEDHLLALRERCSMLADFFMLHAQALEGGARVELSPEGCYRLSELCEQNGGRLSSDGQSHARGGGQLDAADRRPAAGRVSSPARAMRGRSGSEV